MPIYDDAGGVLALQPPVPLTGEFCRKSHMHALVDNPLTGLPESQLVRAQVPHVVSLLVYHSKLQLTPTRREYYIYAPQDLRSSVQIALLLWKRWERGPKPFDVEYQGADWYPKFEDAAVSVPIDDATFLDQWRCAKSRKHFAAGHPEDPFAFTCLDQDVMLYKVVDFQDGLRVKA